MRFHLIMATRGRVAEVERFLASLREQDGAEALLTIVDQNPDGRLDAVVARFGEHIEIEHLKQSRPAASAARNLGLRHPRGALIGFPDDDCIYPPGLLAGIAAVFADRAIDGLSVRILGLDRDEDAFGFGPGRSRPIDHDSAWLCGVTPSMFFRRELAEQVAFDERMGPGATWTGGEDTDYLLRCLDRGARHVYRHELFIRHPMPSLSRPLHALIGREFHYGRGFGYLLARRRIPGRLVREQMALPWSLLLRALATGDWRRAATCPGMGVGRLLGYAEGRRRPMDLPVAAGDGV